jgi:hypothetical protein
MEGSRTCWLFGLTLKPCCAFLVMGAWSHANSTAGSLSGHLEELSSTLSCYFPQAVGSPAIADALQL